VKGIPQVPVTPQRDPALRNYNPKPGAIIHIFSTPAPLAGAQCGGTTPTLQPALQDDLIGLDQIML